MNPVLNKIESLPLELKAIITGDEIISIIDEIGDDFEINPLWRAALVRATIDILSGIMKPGEFIPFIMEEYNMEQEAALQVALAVNERIFSAVKPQLASIHNIEDDKLARRMKVPHKPRYEEISPAITTDDMSEDEEPVVPMPETPSPYTPPIVTNILSTPNLQPVKTAIENKPPQIETTLSSKLDNLRVDQYREKF